MGRKLPCVGAALLLLGLVGCHSGPTSQGIKLLELPEQTRAAVDRQLAGGMVKKIVMRQKDGRNAYHVEGTLDGKEVEYDITSGGKILASKESMPYESLPAAVRMAATLYFGSAEQFAAFKAIEGDKTFYEVQGKKEDKPLTLKLTDTGTVVEEGRE